MDLITKVIHSVVELDAIASQLARVVPEFNFIAEQYGEEAIIDDTGMLVTTPDAAEIIEHLTPEDLMEELYYETGLDDKDRRLSERDDSVVEFAQPVVIADQNHRQAQHMDCGSMGGGCTALWCCQVCGFCWTRRQRQLQQALTLRSRVNPAEDEEQEPKHDQAYLRKVEMHEQRVSAELLKKFRYLLRKQAIPCLGNFWELNVIFKMIH